MTNEEEINTEFRKHTQGWLGLQNIANGIESKKVEERTLAKENAFEYYRSTLENGEEDRENVDNDTVEAVLSAGLGVGRKDTRKYFTENLENILNGVSDDKLEQRVAEIRPVGIENDKNHNKIAARHMEYLRFNNILRAYAEGKRVYEEDEAMLKMNVAKKVAQEKKKEVKEKGYSELVQSLVYIASRKRAFGASGREKVVQVGQEISDEMRKELEDSFDNKSKAKYARDNLREFAKQAIKSGNEEKIDSAIVSTYQAGSDYQTEEEPRQIESELPLAA